MAQTREYSAVIFMFMRSFRAGSGCLGVLLRVPRPSGSSLTCAKPPGSPLLEVRYAYSCARSSSGGTDRNVSESRMNTLGRLFAWVIATQLVCFPSIAQVESTRTANLRQVVNGPCAANTLGGFSQSGILSDAPKRLTRSKTDTDPGQMRGSKGELLTRVLELNHSEVLQIWMTAHSTELADAEIGELARLCSEQNAALKSARYKIAMKSSLDTAARFAKQGSSIFTNPNAISAEIENRKTQSPPKLTTEEELALAALKGSDLAQSALKKISTRVISQINRYFEALNIERGYDEPGATSFK